MELADLAGPKDLPGLPETRGRAVRTEDRGRPDLLDLPGLPEHPARRTTLASGRRCRSLSSSYGVSSRAGRTRQCYPAGTSRHRRQEREAS